MLPTPKAPRAAPNACRLGIQTSRCGALRVPLTPVHRLGPPLRLLWQLDATEEKEVAGKHEIQGYPTLKWFIDGKEVADYSGGRTA